MQRDKPGFYVGANINGTATDIFIGRLATKDTDKHNSPSIIAIDEKNGKADRVIQEAVKVPDTFADSLIKNSREKTEGYDNYSEYPLDELVFTDLKKDIKLCGLNRCWVFKPNGYLSEDSQFHQIDPDKISHQGTQAKMTEVRQFLEQKEKKRTFARFMELGPFAMHGIQDPKAPPPHKYRCPYEV